MGRLNATTILVVALSVLLAGLLCAGLLYQIVQSAETGASVDAKLDILVVNTEQWTQQLVEVKAKVKFLEMHYGAEDDRIRDLNARVESLEARLGRADD